LSLNTNDPRDITAYVEAQLAAPVLFVPFSVANKPTATKWRYHAIYITDTSKPAWMDASGTWKYADGSAV